MTDNTDFDRYVTSWSGCDGGNPNAELWICGIEHGGESDKEVKWMPEPEPNFWGPEFKKHHPDYLTWPYHQKVAKLMIAIDSLRKDPKRIPSLDSYKKYMEEKLYAKDGECFKLNLFPLPSPSVNDPTWSVIYKDNPFLSNKHDYREYCLKRRAVFFKEQRAHYRPKVIIGTGKGFQNEFAMAFGFSGTPEPVELADKRCGYIYTDEGCTLIVSPFFGGRYGMNSGGRLIDLARHVLVKLKAMA